MNGDLSFGEWLKRRRMALGLTQEALAARVGCSTIALRKIEAEDRRPSSQIAERLALSLGVDDLQRDAFVRFARGEILAGMVLPAPLEASRGSSTPPRAGIPRYLTSFVGREAEKSKVEEMVQRPDVRLLVLVGPPGIGKTRLAAEVARDLAQDGKFPGGVDYVSLAETDDPRQVVPAIAHALGLEDPQGAGMEKRLVHAFGTLGRLLVLDNFEQVIEGAPVVADLLGQVPALRVIVTSRAALRVEGEVLFQVPPLSVPGLENLPAPEDLRSFAAVKLFEERARMVRNDFGVTAETSPAVTAICARLDGLPLAIELVAARINQLPPQELLARLGGKLVLHLEGPRGRPTRHQSMDNAVRWSYELLSPGEQSAFRFMGAFVGGFTLEAAEAVCPQRGDSPGEQDIDRIDILEVTTALIDKGLLVPGHEAGGQARFWMLAVIREYALERLEEAGESGTAARRHAEFFRVFAEAAEPELHGPRQVSWLDRVEADLPNLRAALKWSLAEHPDTGLSIAGGLWRFWLVRSDVSEGRDWLEGLLGASARSPGSPTRSRVKAGYVAANLASAQGDTAQAHRLAEECLSAAPDTGDRKLIAFSKAVAGDVAAKDNEFDRAERLLLESLETFREEGFDVGMAFSLASLSLLYITLDRLPKALPLRSECLKLVRRLGDSWGITQALNQLGSIARIECRYAEARAFHEEQLNLARELGSKSSVALALNGLAWAAREEGDLTRAREVYEEALALARETGNKWRLAGVLYGLGVIFWRQGDLPRARAFMEESMAHRLEIGNAQYLVWGRYGLGDVSRAEGNWGEARESYREALTVVQKAGLTSDAAHVVERLGLVAEARGKPDLAARLLGAASRLREIVSCTLPPLDQADHERDVALVRSKLGGAAFESAWAEGRGMSLEEAIDCAFSA